MIECESNQGLISKSGHSPEELFDMLVAFKSFGTENDTVSLVKRKARGLAKNVLRTFGTSDEMVSQMLPTKQTALVRSELGGLPGPLQAEFMQKLCELERDRIIQEIKAVRGELSDDNLSNIKFYGSVLGNDRWPNDLDLELVLKHEDDNLVRLFRQKLQERLFKKVDVKKITVV